MIDRPTRLIPLKPDILGGQGIFLTVPIGLPLALFTPFWSFAFGSECRAAIPNWASFHGHEAVFVTIIAAAYPVCVGGALVTWAMRGRAARRYLDRRRPSQTLRLPEHR